MKLLIIYSQVPFPLSDGGKIASYNTAFQLKRLGHSLEFICLHDSEAILDINKLQDLGTVHIVKHSKKITFTGALKSLLTGESYYLSRFITQDVFSKIDEIFLHNQFDMVISESLHCAKYGLYAKQKYGIRSVLRSQNFETAILERFVRNTSNPIKKIFAYIEYLKVKNIEKNICEVFDSVLMITEQDEKKIKNLNSKIKTIVFPAGVDTERYNPALIHTAVDGNARILWLGALSWPPNRDSVSWFVEKILPSIVKRKKNVILDIVGSNAPENFTIKQNLNIHYHGFVNDIIPYYHACDVCIVPLRIGSGMRVKILEMMAMGKAIVTTSIGCEGIPVSDGVHLFIADSEEIFAQKVLQLLENHEQREYLAKNARLFVENNYDWKKVVERVDRHLTELITR